MRRLLHRLFRKPFFGRFEVPWTWPAGSEASDWDRVHVPSGNGATLVALWGAARGDARGTLVLAHPMGKAAKGFWLKHGHAALFRDAGFNVLLPDANGFGESPAASFDYPGDFLAAGLYASRLTPALPIGLVGASFGAGWGLCAMAATDSPYQFAVLEAAFPTLPEFWRHYPAAQLSLRLSQIVWPAFERRLRPERLAAELTGSPDVLMLYGDADIYTPPAHGQRLLAAMRSSASAEMHVLPGIGHTYALRDAAERYRELVLPFLERSVRRRQTERNAAPA